MKMLGYSTREISEILKISSSAIYVRIHRLKNNKKKLQDDVRK